jgi:hypothetical protein
MAKIRRGIVVGKMGNVVYSKWKDIEELKIRYLALFQGFKERWLFMGSVVWNLSFLVLVIS